MSTNKGDIYQRGGFWLGLDRGAGGKPASPRWYIWWYDASTGHQRRKSTGTSDVRLACDKLDEHYLCCHRPTSIDQDEYTVLEACTDYWLEHGSGQSSAEAIKSRLKLLTRFIDLETEAGRLREPLLPNDIDDTFLNRFRKWAVSEPIVARKKDENGNWVPGKSRPRAASTAEESIIQLKAALNHAFRKRRLRYVTPITHKTRDQVTPERSYRLSLDGIAELLDFSISGAGNSAVHCGSLAPLRRYLIAGVCTLARPDAIFDMNVTPDRGQWLQNERLFALNPSGRLQTKKFRPVLPIADLLHTWLVDTDEWLVCRESKVCQNGSQIVIVGQQKVSGIKSGWSSARRATGVPDGWGPKLIRHSMATILANRRVDLVELEIALGHRVLRKTSSRYAIFDPSYLATIRDGINDVVADLIKKVGPSLHPKLTRVIPISLPSVT